MNAKRYARLLMSLLLIGLLLPLTSQAARLAEPLVITSAGQSSDLLLSRQFFLKAGLEQPRLEAQLSADSLEGVETLVVVVGGSTKGLGQAKDAGEQELARVEALMTRAAELQVQVLCLHVGREARRGAVSDPFITPVASRAAQILVLEGGNADGLFSTISTETGIPLIEAVDYKDCVTQINALFGWEMPER